jgi:hypothetical protein
MPEENDVACFPRCCSIIDFFLFLFVVVFKRGRRF